MAVYEEHYCEGPEATQAFGHSLARILAAGDFIALSGDLGMGKSTLARGLIIEALTASGQAIDDIPSPSFTLVQPYPWPSDEDPSREIWHIDLWRIDGPDEVVELGFDEALGRHVMVVEWPDRLGDMLPEDALHITLTSQDDGKARSIRLESKSASWAGRLQKRI